MNEKWTAIVFVIGVGFLNTGMFMVWQPLGFVALGLTCIGSALVWHREGKKGGV